MVFLAPTVAQCEISSKVVSSAVESVNSQNDRENEGLPPVSMRKGSPFCTPTSISLVGTDPLSVQNIQSDLLYKVLIQRFIILIVASDKGLDSLCLLSGKIAVACSVLLPIEHC